MSRAKLDDNSTTVSLFPFLAVLLCTMGALLVVLVGMTRSARNSAIQRAAAEVPPPSAAVVDNSAQEEIDKVKKYVSQLDAVRSEAIRKLREDQQRLAHLEDHMRRLQDELQKMRLGAEELAALEGEHYDDRKQAEREIERLQELIASTKATIDTFKKERQGKKRAYALVPYEGAHGTTRRPIYLECRDGQLFLQPEGVSITRDDLRPPLGAGNPLASALRAAREYLVRRNPSEGLDRDAEPYPLVVVRPSGVEMYGVVQRAIQNSDFDFGYELVEEDWELKYPAPDPQLAMVAQQAIDQARRRQIALAAAAPRAYRNPSYAASRQFDYGDGDIGGFEGDGEGIPGSGSSGGTGLGGASGGEAFAGTSGSFGGAGGSGSAAMADGNASPSEAYHGDAADESNSAHGTDNSQASAKGGKNAAGGAEQQVAGPVAAGGGASSPPPMGSSVGSSMPGSSEEQQPGAMSIGSPASSASGQRSADLSATRGQDWALKQKQARAVPVRRTVRVIVRDDHLAVLSDDTRRNARGPVSKTIPLRHDTVESIDEFVAAVQNQIEGWGMAGDGLYWRPVLNLHVGPDGQRRADDLARLLRNSGLELQSATAANPNSRGVPRATR